MKWYIIDGNKLKTFINLENLYFFILLRYCRKLKNCPIPIGNETVLGIILQFYIERKSTVYNSREY